MRHILINKVNGFIRTSRQSRSRNVGIGSRELDLIGEDLIILLSSASVTCLNFEKEQVVGTDVDCREGESFT